MIFTIDENTFNTRCEFAIAEPFTKIKEAVKRSSDYSPKWDELEKSQALCICFSNRDGKTARIIWTEKNKKESIAHELVHLVFDILDERGIPVSKENEETFAYLYEFYFKEVMKHYK